MSATRLFMKHERYVAALERQRARIADGLELEYWDDTTPGDKDTHCSWGLCSRDKGAWPEAQDHLWPDAFIERGRVAPQYRVHGQLCPFDRDVNSRGEVRNQGEPMGCFYRCLFFQAQRLGPPPDRKRSLELYDERIALAKRGETPKAAAEHKKARRRL